MAEGDIYTDAGVTFVRRRQLRKNGKWTKWSRWDPVSNPAAWLKDFHSYRYVRLTGRCWEYEYKLPESL